MTEKDVTLLRPFDLEAQQFGPKVNEQHGSTGQLPYALVYEEVLCMAREAGGSDFDGLPSDWVKGYFVISPEQLMRFAALVAAHTLSAEGLRDGRP